jgi:pimeloyl-ACP methyl ester carboxylesterase
MTASHRHTFLDRRQILHLAGVAGAGLVAGCTRDANSAEPQAAIAARSGFVDSDGFKIHYETFGKGDPLVLVHGWGSSLQTNWVDTGWVAALEKTRRVIALDVRGHGDSDKPHDQSAYSYANMSRDVLRVIDRLKIAKADYLGYSMGAFMGVWLVGNARQRFSSMILGGIGDETEESLAALPKIVAGLRAKHPAELTDPVSSAYRAFSERDPRNNREALAVSALQMWPQGYPLKLGGPNLAKVDIPVLIVNGANDHPYIDTVQTLVDAIPNSRLATLSDCDHLSTVTDPRFKQLVLGFLSSRK